MIFPFGWPGFSPAFRYWLNAANYSVLGVPPPISSAAWIEKWVLCWEEVELSHCTFFWWLQVAFPVLHRGLFSDQSRFWEQPLGLFRLEVVLEAFLRCQVRFSLPWCSDWLLWRQNYKWAHYSAAINTANLSYLNLDKDSYKSLSIFVGWQIIQQPFLACCHVLVVDRRSVASKQSFFFGGSQLEKLSIVVHWKHLHLLPTSCNDSVLWVRAKLATV